jgi:hypothetical protein
MESSQGAGKIQTGINQNQQLYETYGHLSTSAFKFNMIHHVVRIA